MMEDTVLWNAILTGGVGVIAWVIRSCMVELNRLNILVNRTREEMAKEYVTKMEQKDQMNYVIDKIEALDAKLDRLLERHQVMDPVTIIGGATVAFNAIKKGIQMGKDLQDMHGQLSSPLYTSSSP